MLKMYRKIYPDNTSTIMSIYDEDNLLCKFNEEKKKIDLSILKNYIGKNIEIYNDLKLTSIHTIAGLKNEDGILTVLLSDEIGVSKVNEMCIKEDLLNNIFINNKGQKYIVLEYLYYKKTEYYFKIRFLETNSEYIKDHRSIKKGSIKDHYSKTIYSIACKGNISSKSPILNRIAFKRWYAMIERCYNKNSISYKSYGAKGIIVSNEWLCFENFFNDLKKIKGFNENLYIDGMIELDKDYNNSKIYNLNNCIFLNKTINRNNQPSKQKYFLAISPTNNKYIYNNINLCSKENNLCNSSIRKILKPNYKMYNHRKWKFISLSNKELISYLNNTEIINKINLGDSLNEINKAIF